MKNVKSTSSFIVGTLVGLAFFIGGYWLVAGDHEYFGMVMFLLVPSVAGFAVAAIVEPAWRAAASCLMALAIGLSVLVVAGLEGIICCMMALPLLAVTMIVGALLLWTVRSSVRKRRADQDVKSSGTTGFLLLTCPLIVVVGDRIERPIRDVAQVETISTSIVVASSPETTWEHLIRLPRMEGSLPYLLRIGLPVPYHCELEGEAVGSKRICYFPRGVISQEITEWHRPRRMALKITENTLPGRKWLTFVDANYDLSETEGGTLVERRTTITSRLYPRWYWRPLEKWGVASEHRYVLSNIKAAAEEER